MKIFRMIIALLVTSLATGSSILAIRAGAGARAGLPNLYKELKIDRSDDKERSLDNNIITKVRDAYLDTNNAHKRRKLLDAFKILAQRQHIWENIYNLDEDGDLSDADDVGKQVAKFINKTNEKIDNAKNIKRLSSDEDDNKAFVKAMLYRIAKPIIERQFNEWKRKNPSLAQEAMDAYNEELSDDDDD